MLDVLIIRTVPVSSFKKILAQFEGHEVKYLSTYLLDEIDVPGIEYKYSSTFSIEDAPQQFVDTINSLDINDFVLPVGVNGVIPDNIKKFIAALRFNRLIIVFDDMERVEVSYDDVGHYFESYEMRVNGLNLLLGVTSFCNLNCRMCDQDFVENKKLLSFEDVKSRIDQYAPYARTISFADFGESFMHPDIGDIYRYLVESHHDVRINIITNAVALLDLDSFREIVGQCETIVFSLNASSRDNYTNIHGKDKFDAVVGNINKYAEVISEYNEKHDGSVIPYISFVAQRDNLHEILGIVHLAHEAGIRNVIIRPILIGKFIDDNVKSVIWDQIESERVDQSTYFCQREYNEMLGQAQELASEVNVSIPCPDRFNSGKSIYRTSSDCYLPWSTAHVTVDGDISFCCFHSSVGNVETEDFDSIWNGKKLANIRNSVNGSERNRICDQCWEHGRYTIDSPYYHFGEGIINKYKIS